MVTDLSRGPVTAHGICESHRVCFRLLSAGVFCSTLAPWRGDKCDSTSRDKRPHLIRHPTPIEALIRPLIHNSALMNFRYSLLPSDGSQGLLGRQAAARQRGGGSPRPEDRMWLSQPLEFPGLWVNL